MNPDVFYVLIPLVAIPFGCGLVAFVGALIFPSTRQAVAAWMHRRASPDALDASASAQLMALRNEVYALRCEVAAGVRILPSGDASERRVGGG
jgi:hypothetical protein